MPYVYHLCSKDFRGTQLYPLNRLKTHLPEIYLREREKWAGRESVLDYEIPGLGMAWADTVNLSALDPRLLVAERRKLGVPFSRLLGRNLVCIPLDRLEGLPCVYFEGKSLWLNSSPGDPDVPKTPPESEFSMLDLMNYEECREVPAFHRDYLIRQRDRGEPALGFVGVPHVLAGGPIDLTGLEFLSLEV